MLIIAAPGRQTEILLVHVPFPAPLKFEGQPSSLLHAAAVLANRLESQGRLSSLSLHDCQQSELDFLADMRRFSSSQTLRVVCLSASTAAAALAAKAAAVIKDSSNGKILVVAGGPHEDDAPLKLADCSDSIDVSIAGDGEVILDRIVEEFFGAQLTPIELEARVFDLAKAIQKPGGRFLVSTRKLGSRFFDRGVLHFSALPKKPWGEGKTRFSVFESDEVIPLMVSRGCSYGKCSFCAEAIAPGRVEIADDFSWLEAMLEVKPNSAVYFQDSIFPVSAKIESKLLSILKNRNVEWGCQVFLGTLTKGSLQLLIENGCRYIYTGLESGSPEIWKGVGKGALVEANPIEKLKWANGSSIRWGLSVMYGAMGEGGALLETSSSVQQTSRFFGEIEAAGVAIAGIYPNIETVLPGTGLHQTICAASGELDFMNQPTSPVFAGMEDGLVGYNFLSLSSDSEKQERVSLAAQIVDSALALQGQASHWW